MTAVVVENDMVFESNAGGHWVEQSFMPCVKRRRGESQGGAGIYACGKAKPRVGFSP